MRDRRFWAMASAASVVGVLLRIRYVMRDRIPGEPEITGDAETYHRLGRLIASGEGYIRPVEYFGEGERVATAEFPPVYPMMLALLDLVGVDSPRGQQLAGALLGGVTIFVVALLGAAVAGCAVGIVAGWIAALSPQLVVFDGSLLSEGPYALMIATALLGTVRSLQTDGDERRWWWLVTAIAVGFAVLTRSEAILLVPMLIVPAARVPGDRREWTRRALTGSSVTIVFIGAWTVRNVMSLGHVQPFTNNNGTLLAGANCDAVYRGVQIGGWRLDCIPERPLTDETEWAAELRDLGLTYLVDHLGEVPAVMAVRVLRTFGLWDVRSNLFFESLEGRDYDWLWTGWYAWIVLAPLAIAGAIIRWRRNELLWPLVVPFGIVVVTSLVSYGNQRFRMIAEPSVAVLAAVAIVALARSVSRRPSDEPHESQSPSDPRTGADVATN